MVDTSTPIHRSWNMGRIKSRGTKPEKIVRSLLHRLGFRFRLNRKDLPGTPDIVLPRFRVVIFVHGCFWHRHENCKHATTPKSNTDFWLKKFHENVVRDKKVVELLEASGWTVIIVWGCETKKSAELSRRLFEEIMDFENY